MSTPLRTPVRNTWDGFNQRRVTLLVSNDAALDGCVLAIGTVNVYGQVLASVNEINGNRANLGLSPIPV